MTCARRPSEPCETVVSSSRCKPSPSTFPRSFHANKIMSFESGWVTLRFPSLHGLPVCLTWMQGRGRFCCEQMMQTRQRYIREGNLLDLIPFDLQITDEVPEMRQPLLEFLGQHWSVSFKELTADDGWSYFIYRCVKGERCVGR
jgi:hypothetical protein